MTNQVLWELRDFLDLMARSKRLRGFRIPLEPFSKHAYSFAHFGRSDAFNENFLAVATIVLAGQQLLLVRCLREELSATSCGSVISYYYEEVVEQVVGQTISHWGRGRCDGS